MKAKITLTTLLLLLANSAFAGDGFTIKVGRDYQVSVQSGAVTAVALGEHARADVNLGGIQVENTSVDIGRDYKVDIKTGAVTGVALGKNVSARINGGGIQQGSRP